MTRLNDPSEPLARYLTSSNHFSRIKNRVKPGAFLPPSNLRFSVFRIRNFSESKIWQVGIRYVTKSRKTLHGRAELGVQAVESVDLDVVRTCYPPRHAEILGWPIEKDHQKSIALDLAELSTLKLHP